MTIKNLKNKKKELAQILRFTPISFTNFAIPTATKYTIKTYMNVNGIIKNSALPKSKPNISGILVPNINASKNTKIANKAPVIPSVNDAFTCSSSGPSLFNIPYTNGNPKNIAKKIPNVLIHLHCFCHKSILIYSIKSIPYKNFRKILYEKSDAFLDKEHFWFLFFLSS